ncbi:hypothetical protein ABTE25_18860 [Acinetobacter baumannii]|uniref:phage tail fiber protein n=1 Tax=Acinetobacter baumannii TaxID=470 RepID=UPI000F41974C|nr:hypothetical protein [Acinetobacter baumannii]MDQ9872371.1 hypothetical protein [Acinetobacter baumannii]RNH98162.1 hypothetical protein EEW84_18955 [Acinetobacter baumannii]
MTIQTINLGTAPSGAGGDTFRSTGSKVNENFSNPSHAASRYVGTDLGNVMEVGAFGLGGSGPIVGNINSLADIKGIVNGKTRIIRTDGGGLLQLYSPVLYMKTGDTNIAISIGALSGDIKVLGWTDNSTTFTAQYALRTTGNTTVDSNGFIKAASPIVKLYADKVEMNEEAADQDVLFEKVDVGHYLIKGSLGFAQDGWYIEMPKNANGNVLVAVLYQQHEDNTIEVKTLAKKFDEETGDIVPNLEKPRDIPAGRWIDIRLKGLQKSMPEVNNEPQQ